VVNPRDGPHSGSYERIRTEVPTDRMLLLRCAPRQAQGFAPQKHGTRAGSRSGIYGHKDVAAYRSEVPQFGASVLVRAAEPTL